MRLRVIRCDECGWVNASECSHWSMTCPRAKKAKKAHHKLKKQGSPGFDVMVNGLTCSDDLLPDYVEGKVTIEQLVENDPHLLDLSPKRYIGTWQHTRADIDAGYFLPQGSQFVPAPMGNLIECAMGCGLLGAE